MPDRNSTHRPSPLELEVQQQAAEIAALQSSRDRWEQQSKSWQSMAQNGETRAETAEQALTQKKAELAERDAKIAQQEAALAAQQKANKQLAQSAADAKTRLGATQADLATTQQSLENTQADISGLKTLGYRGDDEAFRRDHKLADGTGIGSPEMKAAIEEALKVQNAQKALHELGLYNGPTKGIDDKATGAAFARFQAQHKGEQDLQTAKLTDSGAATALADAENVMHKQTELADAGYYHGRPDGIDGRNTQTAEAAFRKDFGVGDAPLSETAQTVKNQMALKALGYDLDRDGPHKDGVNGNADSESYKTALEKFAKKHNIHPDDSQKVETALYADAAKAKSEQGIKLADSKGIKQTATALHMTTGDLNAAKNDALRIELAAATGRDDPTNLNGKLKPEDIRAIEEIQAQIGHKTDGAIDKATLAAIEAAAKPKTHQDVAELAKGMLGAAAEKGIKVSDIKEFPVAAAATPHVVVAELDGRTGPH